MRATTDLRTEHVAVLRMLDVLHVLGERAAAGCANDDAADIAECIDFLRGFVDRCHHAKEEELLFPAMRGDAQLDPAEEHMIGRLLADHAEAREAVARLEAGEVAPAIERYETIVRPHIMLEENACFDIADRRLPPETQRRLAEGYESVERDVLGAGRHTAYMELLDRLGEKYL
jgi:hemerythrin-like domain-containing protein